MRPQEEHMTSMSKRIVLGLSAAAITVALAGVGFATSQGDPAQNPPAGAGQGRFGGPGGRFGRGGPGGPMGLAPMMLGRLNLTSDQQDRVKQIMDSHKQDQQAIGKRAMAARDALESAVTSPSFDETVIRQRAADLAAVDADQAVMRARIYAQVLQILTPDQQAKLKTMQTEMEQRRAERGQKQ
jgi:Spy/CpxP family protein refolding chaperone